MRRRVIEAYTDYPFLPEDKDAEIIPLRGVEVIAYDGISEATINWDGTEYKLDPAHLYREAKRINLKPKRVLKGILKRLPANTETKRVIF